MQDIYSGILEYFGEKRRDLRSYSPLTLAYIGDAVYDLVIRSLVVGEGNSKAARLHEHSSSLVNARFQSSAIRALMPLLTEKEAEAYRRGRNAHSATTAKGASVTEYREATGFEALIGHLYMNGEWERILKLISAGIEYGTDQENER